MVSRIVEITFTLIILYLVLDKADGFSSALGAIGGAYVESVKTLQGR